MLLLCCLNCSALCFASVCGFCCSWDISWKRELWEYTALSNTSAREVARARGASSSPQFTSSSLEWNVLANGSGTTKKKKSHHNPPENKIMNKIMAREMFRFLNTGHSCCVAMIPTALRRSALKNGFILSEAQVEDPGWSHAHLASVPGLCSLYKVAARGCLSKVLSVCSPS